MASRVGIFLGVQLLLLALGESWLLEIITGDVDLVSGRRDSGEGSSWIYGAGRIWAIVMLVDLVWTTAEFVYRRQSKP